MGTEGALCSEQVSALCLSLPALVTSSGVLALVCFFIFEAACGIYFPSMGIIKSQYVRALSVVLSAPCSLALAPGHARRRDVDTVHAHAVRKRRYDAERDRSHMMQRVTEVTEGPVASCRASAVRAWPRRLSCVHSQRRSLPQRCHFRMQPHACACVGARGRQR